MAAMSLSKLNECGGHDPVVRLVSKHRSKVLDLGSSVGNVNFRIMNRSAC